ncbi:hypothetical protein ACN9M1_17105 [Ralstonia sp. R-29]|uniref:hypothetical protein n=1 Tax=Ralstonia sp. R-29 TaxID=3404059 RepID=UPI003CF82D12
MPRKIEHRSEESGFDCLVPDNLPELYADGVSSLQVGMPISRIMFHATTADGEQDKPEQRVAKLSVVIPTVALLELVANIATETGSDTAAATNAAAKGFAESVAAQIQRLADITEIYQREKGSGL